MTQNDHANTEPLRELAQSNSKSEDTPDPSRVDELTDKLRGLLNKDGVWSSEYNGVLLEIEELATSEPPQDTSLDLRKAICDVFGVFPEELEHNLPGGIGLRKCEELEALFAQQRAKLFEQIRSEVLKTANPAGVDMTCARLLKAEQREALNRLESKQ